MKQADTTDVLRVQIYADIACPWCRLGHHRLAGAAADLGTHIAVEAVHRPFQLDPDDPEQPRPLRQSLGRKYDAESVSRMFAKMTALGEEEGLTFNLDSALAVNTVKAHQLLWLASRDYDPTMQASLIMLLFDAYFQHSQDVANHDVLVNLAVQAGMDGAHVRHALEVGEGRDEVIAEAKAARARGITSVPTMVFPDEESISGSRDVLFLVDLLRRHAAGRVPPSSG